MTAHLIPHGRLRHREPGNFGPVLLLVLLTWLAAGLGRADEWLMKIDGIKGDVTDRRYEGWIRLSSVGTFLNRIAISNHTGSVSYSYGGRIGKPFDRASPALLNLCVASNPIPRVTLAYVLTQPNAPQYRIVLTEVGLASLKQSPVDGVAMESLDIRFRTLEWTCFQLDDNGGAVGGLTSVVQPELRSGILKNLAPFRAVISRPAEARSSVVVSFPASKGHRYRLLGSASGSGWESVAELTAAEDGELRQAIPLAHPYLLLRVEEFD